VDKAIGVDGIRQEVAGMTPEERDVLILNELREINGKVREHHRLWFGAPGDPDDHGWLPEIRANTDFRRTWQIGGKLGKALLPIFGTGIIANLILGIINFLQAAP
jgi:hypothetical protein